MSETTTADRHPSAAAPSTGEEREAARPTCLRRKRARVGQTVSAVKGKAPRSKLLGLAATMETRCMGDCKASNIKSGRRGANAIVRAACHSHD